MRRAVAACAALALILMLPQLLQSITDSFLFHPRKGQWRTPAALGIPFEDLRLTANDGVELQAWWLPGGGDVAVVTFHGNGATIADLLDHNATLVQLGVSVLALEYRGYGDSGGRPSEEGLALDAATAFAEARRRRPKLVAHGRSLGGAVAIRGASEAAVDGLIVESTFTTLREMAGKSGIPLASHLVAYEFASIDRIPGIAAPTLVVHGRADELIPVQMGERLRDAAGGPVTWFEVPNGTHNDTWVRGGAAYWSALRGFLGGI